MRLVRKFDELGRPMRSRYNTMQRSEIIACLAGSHGHMTAAAVAEHLAARGSDVSKATVYRQLEKLVEEGLVVKSNPQGQRSACFELVDKSACCEERCYHLKCEKCGSLIHLGCEEVEELCKHMLEHHGFRVDMTRTVFFGVCADCGKDSGAEHGA